MLCWITFLTSTGLLRTLYSTHLCMYWDRFAPDTAGGAWSPQVPSRRDRGAVGETLELENRFPCCPFKKTPHIHFGIFWKTFTILYIIRLSSTSVVIVANDACAMIVFLGSLSTEISVRCQGLLNNGDGCLTTHLSDIGLFIDGRPVNVLEVRVTRESPSGRNIRPGSTLWLCQNSYLKMAIEIVDFPIEHGDFP